MNAKMGSLSRSGLSRKTNDSSKFILTIILAVLFGFFVGISFPPISLTKIHTHSSFLSAPYIPSSKDMPSRKDMSSTKDIPSSNDIPSTKDIGSSKDIPFSKDILSGKDISLSKDIPSSQGIHSRQHIPSSKDIPPSKSFNTLGGGNVSKIYVPTKPRGTELLPSGIIVLESDLYLRRLWGEPSEDLKKKPKYLVTFTVGYDQRDNINAAVRKFSDDFTIMLFHYDGRVTEWDQYEWSRSAIHVSVRRQTKWWYAKRFLHPDIVSAYEYIFIWDEDLGVEHFNAKKYIQLVKKHGLEISQPGLEPNNGLTWQMTKRRGDSEVHKDTEEKPGWCADPHLPPCAAFVEIMAPVFSREAWRCVWHMIQNDLVHGWGLDFSLRRCVEPAHEKIGVVDSQWIIHQVIPSLGNQGQPENGRAPWEGVRARCRNEWAMFRDRLENADEAYLSQMNKE